MLSIDFALTTEYIGLHKLLKLTDVVDSSGADKAVVTDGAVTVDGQPELCKTVEIQAGQIAMLGDVRIVAQDPD